MATAPRKGLNKARRLGSAPDNAGLSEYKIASGYGTALGAGDLVKITTDGTIIRGTNAAYNIGVLHSVHYYDAATKRIIDSGYWPASQTSPQPITCLVMDDPSATYHVKCSSPLGDMVVGDFYPMALNTPDAATMRSTMLLNNTATRTGTLAVTGTNNAALAGLANNDTFSVSTSVNTTPVVITIVTNQTPAQLLALLNAVPGISASLNGSNYLVLTATDGGDIILADGTGTPLTDSNLIGAAGTITPVVAKNASAVKVVSIVDVDNRVVEVALTNDELRANI